MIEWLEEWYLSNCDSDWEHCYGIKIGTLDNPGWTIDIDLTGTEIEQAEFVPLRIERTDNDWIHCSVKDGVFVGRGGPRNLKEILSIFRDWVAKNKELNT